MKKTKRSSVTASVRSFVSTRSSARSSPTPDSDLEQLAAFARKLLPNLQDGLNDQIRLEDDVELEFYHRLQRVSSGAIEFGDDGRDRRHPRPRVGTGPHRRGRSSALLRSLSNLNDRFGTAFTETDRLFLGAATTGRSQRRRHQPDPSWRTHSRSSTLRFGSYYRSCWSSGWLATTRSSAGASTTTTSERSSTQDSPEASTRPSWHSRNRRPNDPVRAST